jgi:hypothetical protein
MRWGFADKAVRAPGALRAAHFLRAGVCWQLVHLAGLRPPLAPAFREGGKILFPGTLEIQKVPCASQMCRVANGSRMAKILA